MRIMADYEQQQFSYSVALSRYSSATIVRRYRYALRQGHTAFTTGKRRKQSR
jgi:hypothetical protein